ncbi:MAG: aminotransferase class V-fold PLP-dependent enzyme, partial [Candidatus Tectomicrobia bacterium]|nr:aminotransferase class V-fold PLP-dependent enzyme [Candidatus Tectomicrobia bacterium]
MTPRPIYLDHHATTPLDSAVLEAMMPYLTDRFGNASSRTHAYGWEAEEAIHPAPEPAGALIQPRPEG